ncbi:MAG: helix-turn-helix transcriptional regulator [Phycisphaeraceae bacterium]
MHPQPSNDSRESIFRMTEKAPGSALLPTHPHERAVQPRVQPPLSTTERTVLGYLLQGMTERQVANELDRSHNTVHVHVRNIYRKLGVTSRKMLFHAMAQDPSIMRAQKRA